MASEYRAVRKTSRALSLDRTKRSSEKGDRRKKIERLRRENERLKKANKKLEDENVIV